MNVFYFGCMDDLGHYLFNSEGSRMRMYDVYTAIPWGANIDSGLCVQDKGYNQPQGAALIHHAPANDPVTKSDKPWTALSFWDRSVDKRYGSNSNFIANDLLVYSDMAALAREKFPEVWERFKFQVYDVRAEPFIRAAGDVHCDCGQPYWKHRNDPTTLGPDGQPFLKIRCDGRRLKL